MGISVPTKDNPVKFSLVSMVLGAGIDMHQHPENHPVRYHVALMWDGLIVLQSGDDACNEVNLG